MDITKNFTLSEFITSPTAKSRGIKNMPGEKEIENIKSLVLGILQPVREKYGKPIKVNSGYRCIELNKAVGGAKTSEHLTGSAADIKAPDGDNASLFRLIKNMMESGEIEVGQLIWEYGSKVQPSWIHVSLPGKHHNQTLYLYSKK